jgi:hypothetical protein
MAAALVDVLLATWNGGRHLAALLDSLLAQTHTDFRVLVSDDGSTDGTLTLLERYRPRFGGRMLWLPPRPAGRGGLGNFEYLMQASLDEAQAPWAMFCDQDDVWLPEKIAQTLVAMQRTEQDAEPGMPCLVHTDLRVVDEALATMADSFVRYQHMDPARCTPRHLLSMNQVTGCATMVNRGLLAMALPIPAEVVVHDWWCAVLSGSGRRVFVDQPTLLYRQHAVNQIGAHSRSLHHRVLRLLRDAPAVLRRAGQAGRNSYRQAQALEQRLRSLQRDASQVADYLAWRNQPLWQRIRTYRAYYPGSEMDRLLRCLLWPTPARGKPPQHPDAAQAPQNPQG